MSRKWLQILRQYSKEDNMKKQYKKPEIITEVLLKDDVLEMSYEKDNGYAASKSIFIDDFKIDDILN